MSRSNQKVTSVVFCDWQGVTRYKYVPCGQTAVKFYITVLKSLREAVRHKRRQSWVLHHDIVLAHSLLLVHDFQAKNKTTIIQQPRYSPYMLPLDFLNFLSWSQPRKKCHFNTIDKTKSNSQMDLFPISKEFQNALHFGSNVGSCVLRAKGTTSKARKLRKLYILK